jgi:predicted methyltransferase
MRIRRILGVAAALALVAAAPGGGAKPSQTILAAVADPARPAEDVARDASRKPAEMLAFAGVRPGDRVAELAPGGGYYTRILARAVGPKGKVYAFVSKGFAAREGAMDKLKATLAPYPNVEIVVGDYTAMTFPEPVDLVWTSENYHDFHNGPTANVAALNQAAFAALKKGGRYYIEDHAAPGTGVGATSTLHRIDPAAVRSEVAAAGFQLEAESTVLANKDDPHTAKVDDPAIRGHTDKFAMRFRKPR